jgi:outer membrane protein OmpA-like peptidoglycan-associated protein
MKNTSTNIALAILFFGASMVKPAQAQVAPDPAGSNTNPNLGSNTTAAITPGSALRYVGGDTRIGLGYDSEVKVRAEISQVLQSAADSATIAEAWVARRAGGLKISRNWLGSETAVSKLFAAVDQGENRARKLTLGGGQEYQNWYWSTYLSKGLSGARQSGSATASAIRTISGVDAGRPFEQDITTTTVTNTFERAYEWGVGARVGHFYEDALLRITGGLDQDIGKFSNRQTTASLLGEKYFAGSPVSLAVSLELARRSGDVVTDRNDARGMVTLRYEFGAPASNFRPSKITRTVVSTERVPDPNWTAPPVVVTPPPTAAATNERTTETTSTSLVASGVEPQETYFEIGASRLNGKAIGELDGLISRIDAAKPFTSLKVDITGHTCPTGSDKYNYPLSQRRADAVKKYLITKGVDTNVITSVGKAGKDDSKYPEVKGLGFRHRRADTEVVVTKEVASTQRTAVADPPVVVPPAPSPTAPMIDRQVSREVVEDAPNPWKARALRSTVPHKTSVDVYRFTQTSATESTGARRFLNRGPAAVNDSFTANCGAASTFNVLANDTDADGDPLTITSVSAPGKGTAVISGNRIVYTPSASACGAGTDSFTYTVSDNKGGTSTATVNVTLQAANDAPIAADDSYIVNCGVTASLNVLSNDRDPNGDPLRITAVTQPTQGTSISIASDGRSLNLTPGRSCFIRDAFTYTISDGRGGTSTATVTLIDP